MAKVEYAPAIRMALGDEVPMENEGTVASAMKASSFRPAATATSLTLSVPTSMPSCTKGELADFSMAVRRSISP
ncbi:hypothetical protein GA0115253_1036372 [Streptomyces sp. Termitarium-T10T-6]|nr:hypothetical protein GA0115253_1036372 [Streptomyces sp. Termitarium-T10T-6]